jgi:hypothetical protein
MKVLDIRILNPFNIFLLMLFCVLLQILQLTNAISVVTPIYLVFVSVCLIAFIIPGILFQPKREKIFFSNVNYKKDYIFFIKAIYFISLFTNLYEYFYFFQRFGNIPILLADFEVKRLLFPINGYVHLIAMLHFPLIGFFYWVSKVDNKAISKKEIVFYFFMSGTLSLMIGNRGTFSIMLINIFIIKMILSSISYRKLIFFFVIFLYLLGAFKLFRDFSFYGDSVFKTIDDNSVFSGNWITGAFFYSYNTLVMNFEFLLLYLEENIPHQYGYFTVISPFASFLPFDLMTEQEFQKNHLDISFHGTITGTGFAIPYIDFGPFAPVLVFLITAVFYYLRLKLVSRKLIYLIPGIVYFYINLLLFFYTYTFNKFYILLNIIMLFFISIFSIRTYR